MICRQNVLAHIPRAATNSMLKMGLFFQSHYEPVPCMWAHGQVTSWARGLFEDESSNFFRFFFWGLYEEKGPTFSSEKNAINLLQTSWFLC